MAATRIEKEFRRMGAGNTWGGIRLIIYKMQEQKISRWQRLRLALALWILPKTKGNPV